MQLWGFRRRDFWKISKYCDAPEELRPAFGQLKAEEPRGPSSFCHGSDLVLALTRGGCDGKMHGDPCSWSASAVPAGLSCCGLAGGEDSSSFHPPFPSRPLLLGDGAGSGPFSEAGWRKGDYRRHQKESGVTLLPLCPMDPAALVKYLKRAGPGLGLEECRLWKIDPGARGN